MRKRFPGYCGLTESEFSQLWEKCLFAFDANVLLNLYRYTPQTKDSMISIMQKISNRIWLPYQAAIEYHKRRIGVIQQQSKAYDEILNIVKKEHEVLSGQLNKFKRHPSIQISGILDKLKSSLSEIDDLLTQLKKEHPDFLTDDPIRAAILKLFDGKVGNPTSDAELSNIYKQGEERYRLKIPPGYEDKEKGGTDQYGDLVIWFQVIAKTKEDKIPMIFITDDRKDDWWLKIEGKTIGPQPELVQEISEKDGVSFYMYSADPFMKYAGKYLKHKVEKKAINEVREVRKEDEILRKNYEDILKSERIADIIGTIGTSGSSTNEILNRYEAGKNARRALIESLGTSGSSTSEILNRYEVGKKARRSLTSEFLEKYEQEENARRALLESAGTAGSLASEFIRKYEQEENARRALLESAGTSGSLASEFIRKYEQEENARRALLESAGSSIGKIAEPTKPEEKSNKIDSSDIGKKDE